MGMMAEPSDRAAAGHRGRLAGAFEPDQPAGARSLTRARTHTFSTERMTIEPFDLRMVPRHSLVIDRLAHWYYAPREWLKKVALMNDVYLMNNPFTFQAMEKHAAYCAMMRLGPEGAGHVDDPAQGAAGEPALPLHGGEVQPPFDLEEVARAGRLPPIHEAVRRGGLGRRDPRSQDDEELHARYDESGETSDAPADLGRGLRRVRPSLSIGAETMVMQFRPDRPDARPVPGRARFPHARARRRDRHHRPPDQRLLPWEFNSCETIVKGGQGLPDRLRQRVPRHVDDQPPLLLPMGDQDAGQVGHRSARHRPADEARQDMQTYFEIGDRDDLSYEQKLEEYRRLADEHFDIERYNEFCNEHLQHDRRGHGQYFIERRVRRLLVDTVRSTFPHTSTTSSSRTTGACSQAWVTDQN